MRWRFARLRIAAWRSVVLAATLLLAACSAVQLAYDHADTLVRWELGRYVRLDASQRAQWTASFDALWRWHRTTQLPAYVAVLRDLSADVAHGALTPTQVRAYATRVETLTDTVYREALPPAGALLATLSDAQVAALLARMHADIAKEAAQHVDEDADARRVKASKALARGLRGWIGRLSDTQKAMVDDWSRGLPLQAGDEDAKAADTWVERLGVVLAARREAGFAQRLDRFADEPYDATRAKEDSEQQARWLDLLARLSATLSDEQRQRFCQRLEGYAHDFEVLSKEVAPSA